MPTHHCDATRTTKGAPEAQERLEMGIRLNEIKSSRRYLDMGYRTFDQFLESEEIPLKHSAKRAAMALARRKDLHGVLELGMGRLGQLMRLSPLQASTLLRTGTPAGPVFSLSVRRLASEVDKLLQRQLRTIPGLSNLKPSQTEQHKTFVPDTNLDDQSRRAAARDYLLALGKRVKADGKIKTLHMKMLPPSVIEKAVVYLDLCTRDPLRKSRLEGITSLESLLRRILAGKDWLYNQDQNWLRWQMVYLAAPDLDLKSVSFWKSLFKTSCPPERYMEFIRSLRTRLDGEDWYLMPRGPYSAELLLYLLKSSAVRLFWQVASTELGVTRLIINWREGSKKLVRVWQLPS